MHKNYGIRSTNHILFKKYFFSVENYINGKKTNHLKPVFRSTHTFAKQLAYQEGVLQFCLQLEQSIKEYGNTEKAKSSSKRSILKVRKFENLFNF